jgi:hypothetical protein
VVLRYLRYTKGLTWPNMRYAQLKKLIWGQKVYGPIFQWTISSAYCREPIAEGLIIQAPFAPFGFLIISDKELFHILVCTCFH